MGRNQREYLNKKLNELRKRLDDTAVSDYYYDIGEKQIHFQIPPMGNMLDVKEIALTKYDVTKAEYWKKVLDGGKYGVYQLDHLYMIDDRDGIYLVFSKNTIESLTHSFMCVSKSDSLNQANLGQIKKLS